MDDSSLDLDALATGREVEEIGSICLVRVPGFSLLSEAQRRQVVAKVERIEIGTPLDVEALDDALQSLQSGPLAPPTEPPEYNADEDFSTPPPMDEEEEIQESRVFEAKARKKLENEGCPPCYPANLEVPLQNPPEEYRGIISYWESLSAFGIGVLCRQASDWEQFCRRRAMRQPYRWRHLNDFEDEIRRRRHKYGVQGDIYLQRSILQQNRLQNWVEYQDYHFREHEKIEREIADLRKRLEDEPQHASIYQGRLAYAERRLVRHEILLQWNEQQRIAMEGPPLMERDDYGNALKAVRRPPGPGRRKRQPSTRAVFGEAGVSKPKQRYHHQSRGSQHKASDVVPAIRHANPPQTDIPLGQEGRPNKPRYAKEAALRQIRPQRASKARAPLKPPLATQLRGVGQQRATDRAQPRRRQFPQSSPSVSEVKTRSGRVSRKPTRWVPDLW
ncbi:MAG: hypothetical protein M1816_001419 [Peltula sp. TS41687]|nr:MAG: hypothetical protein M1816_001419 [Peltula sp. TS41687]